MTRILSVRSRQRTRPVDTRQLRRIALWALEERFGDTAFELGIHLVGAAEMARVNGTFLNHEGSTDVITFDQGEGGGGLHGELFICVDDAVAQARRFRTTWQGEVVRYVLHGLLHLHGFDDLEPAARRRMKREENRLVRLAARRFSLRRVARA